MPLQSTSLDLNTYPSPASAFSINACSGPIKTDIYKLSLMNSNSTPRADFSCKLPWNGSSPQKNSNDHQCKVRVSARAFIGEAGRTKSACWNRIANLLLIFWDFPKINQSHIKLGSSVMSVLCQHDLNKNSFNVVL